MHEYQMDYSKQVKQFIDNKAVQAELEIHNGMPILKAVKTFGYKDTQSMMMSIMHRGKLLPLTNAEKLCFFDQINHRIGHAFDRKRIAKTIGLSTDTLEGWASGQRMPAPCLINNIAKALGCTRDDLLSPVKDPKHVGASKHTVKKADPKHDGRQSSSQADEEPVTDTQPPPIPERKQNQESGALKIVRSVTAEGRYGTYSYDGTTITVNLYGKFSGSSEWLYKLGEELQDVATSIT